MPEVHAVSHYPLDELRWTNERAQWFQGSRVLLANQNANTALLFVHGWGGSASGTWEDFQRAVRFSPETAAADAFFLNYPTRRTTVPFCAGEARRFLRDLLHDPANTMVNGSLPRGVARRAPGIRYDRVVVIAHSMGAVVVRRALLDLDRPDAANALDDADRAKIRLLFFAPAHTGSTLPLLIASGLGLDAVPGAKMLGELLSVRYRSLRDLAIGSRFLGKLAGDNAAARERRQAAGASTGHLIAFVFHAENDKVVEQDDFDLDPPLDGVMDKHHRSLCKPDETYRKPVAGLLAVLGAARPAWPQS
jgi:pimeloyl-ACP methyl ester carboxylesterase